MEYPNVQLFPGRTPERALGTSPDRISRRHVTPPNNTGPGEDFELTLRIRKLGYKVRFVRGASASLEAAASFEGLVRQRLRWDRDALNI